jgi:putative addiction module component (TIGR02574 family)
MLLSKPLAIISRRGIIFLGMKNREFRIEKRSATLGLSPAKSRRNPERGEDTMMRSITQLTMDELTDELLTLPDRDRAMLADRLWASLHDDGLDEDDNTPLSPAWSAEIKRRISAFENGETEGIPAEDVLVHVQQLLDQMRP